MRTIQGAKLADKSHEGRRRNKINDKNILSVKIENELRFLAL